MDSKRRINALFNRQPTDRVGLWMGHPVKETLDIYFKYFGVNSIDELSKIIGDDMLWAPAEWTAWNHPEGRPLWDVMAGKERKTIVDSAIFAECEDIKEVEAFEWPDPKYMDFTRLNTRMNEINAQGKVVLGGCWTYVFQLAVDFFGMENLFVKMYTDPEIVEAVIERIVEFYMIANKKLFDISADKIGVFFWANDLGSQTDLLISPELFKKFFLPGFKKIIGLAKSYQLPVLLHSCGAISKIIPLLIDAGIDGLHPLQAKASGMDAESLAKEYKNDLVFVGGVDTQELLPCGTPEDVKKEVRRLKKLFGDRFIVSPSHEGVLPDISVENIIAMRDAALE